MPEIADEMHDEIRERGTNPKSREPSRPRSAAKLNLG